MVYDCVLRTAAGPDVRHVKTKSARNAAVLLLPLLMPTKRIVIEYSVWPRSSGWLCPVDAVFDAFREGS
jgi:hypothetical protein